MLSRKNLNLPNNGKLDKIDLFFCKKSFVAIKNKTKICIVTTGIAGPNGGTKLKPVGLVYIGIKVNKSNYIFKKIYKGKRLDIQRKTRDFIFSKINQLI